MSPLPSPSVRFYYLFTAVVLGLGAVLSVFQQSWTSLAVFSVLCALAVFVAARAGAREAAEREAEQGAAAPQRERPSERRRRRNAGGDAG